MRNYAERMERYFLKRDVDRRVVQDSLRQWLESGKWMIGFDTRDEVLTMLPGGRVRVQLIEDVTIDGPAGHEQRSIPSELYLRKNAGS